MTEPYPITYVTSNGIEYEYAQRLLTLVDPVDILDLIVRRLYATDFVTIGGFSAGGGSCTIDLDNVRLYVGGDTLIEGNLAVEGDACISGHLSVGSISLSSGDVTLASGNVGIGTTNPGETMDIRGNARVGASTESNYIAFRGTTSDDQNPYTHTYIGERIWESGTEKSELVLFKGNDTGTTFGPDRVRIIGAELLFDSYPSSVSGSFESVCTDASLSQKFKINNSGALGFAGDNYGTSGQVLISGGSSTTPSWQTLSLISSGDSSALITDTGSGAFTVNIDGSERIRIDGQNAGSVHINCTGISNSAPNQQGAIIHQSNGNTKIRGTSTNNTLFQFYYYNNTSSTVGNITVSPSSTSYVTSSDYRLKENIVPIKDAMERVEKLNPVRFNFLVDSDTTVDGFLAHEVQEIIPESIVGEKDAVDDNGNPIYQGIDQSKIVPLLAAALKDAIKEISNLKSRIELLENA